MNYRRIFVLAILAVLVLCFSQASAEITLKKSFWTGWKYSVDGQTYHNVGYSGNDLRDVMLDNEQALALMGQYQSYKMMAAFTGAVGGALIGWPLGGYAGNGEWKDSYTTMMWIGGGATVLSIFMDGTATSRLKEAVKLHNENQTQSLGLMLDFKPTEASQTLTCFVGVSIGF